MNAVDVLKYGSKTFHDALNVVPQAMWLQAGVCGTWSVKDLIAHLASYEHLLVEVLAPFAGSDVETPTIASVAEHGFARFNDVQVEARAQLTPQEALAEYEAAFDEVMRLAPEIQPQDWRQLGTLPWYGQEYALDDFVVYSFYGHKREHSAQIHVFGDRLAER